MLISQKLIKNEQKPKIWTLYLNLLTNQGIKDANYGLKSVAVRIDGLNKNSGIEVGIIGADLSTIINDIMRGLQETKRFTGITSIDTSRVTPTLEELEVFDSVMIWSNYAFADENKLGDVVADYADKGKGVVTCLFENLNDWYGSKKYQLGGRWLSQNYGIYEGSTTIIRNPTGIGHLLVPNHPLMKDVQSFSAKTQSCRMTGKMRQGAVSVVNWSDNLPLIAYKESPRLIAGLNFWPASSRVFDGGWDSSTDGWKIMANALEWTGQGGSPD